MLENAISKVSNTLEPRLSGSIPSSSKVFASFSSAFSATKHRSRPIISDAKLFLFLCFSIADANQAYTEGFRKGVCNHFVKTGFCQYGDSCKYFHPKNNLSNVNAQGVSGVVVQDSMGVSWGNLPPSLMPPPEEGYPPLPFVDWG
ncbi:zinc finger CCCH domain-containing protein 3 isoform X1 [Juglans regia]|uniref:Zinc finger CCCH domain-containing protein 3 isoform X1 n=2 Tax=Juglans regia TaxID=51240 RepID=A0A2I4EAN4_JUGRE|nr:zinc finger CCCH domain-containing protein 3 isoform X1 [Juglans regia]